MASKNFFIDLFGQSPFDPLQKHIAIAHECALELLPFFKAVYAQDWTLAATIQQKISQLENDADDIQNEIQLQLPKSLFLPVPRSDLISLLIAQDKIANRAEDIAGLMLGREMTIPEPLKEPVLTYLKTSLAASNQAVTAINELDELVETAFSGREVQLVKKIITKLDDIEHQTDQIQIDIRAALFKIETQLPPIEVIFLYKIIEGIGDLADRAQKVGSQLQLLLAR